MHSFTKNTEHIASYLCDTPLALANWGTAYWRADANAPRHADDWGFCVWWPSRARRTPLKDRQIRPLGKIVLTAWVIVCRAVASSDDCSDWTTMT